MNIQWRLRAKCFIIHISATVFVSIKYHSTHKYTYILMKLYETAGHWVVWYNDWFKIEIISSASFFHWLVFLMFWIIIIDRTTQIIFFQFYEYDYDSITKFKQITHHMRSTQFKNVYSIEASMLRKYLLTILLAKKATQRSRDMKWIFSDGKDISKLFYCYFCGDWRYFHRNIVVSVRVSATFPFAFHFNPN